MTAIVPFHKALKARREQLGISWDRAAAMLCLSDMEYYDLEAYEREWLDVVPAYVIGFAVSIFEIDWRKAYAWPVGGSVEPTWPFDKFLRSIREDQGLTREEFADRIGLSEVFTEVVEGHPHGLALWPVEIAVLLAQAFEISVIGLAEYVLEPRAFWERIAAGRRGS